MQRPDQQRDPGADAHQPAGRHHHEVRVGAHRELAQVGAEDPGRPVEELAAQGVEPAVEELRQDERLELELLHDVMAADQLEQRRGAAADREDLGLQQALPGIAGVQRIHDHPRGPALRERDAARR